MLFSRDRVAGGLALLALAGCASASALDLQVREPALVIGSAGVTATWKATLVQTAEVQVLRWPAWPDEADPSSLMLYARRAPVRLLNWQLMAEPSGPAGPGLRPDAEGNLVWRPGWIREAGRSAGHGLQLTVSAPDPHPREVEVSYRFTGLTWRVDYQVQVRGDLQDEAAPLAMDVEGRVKLAQAGQGSYVAARVALLADAAPAAPAQSGFLLLDEESPLADAWRDQAPPSPVIYRYDLKDLVDVRAQSESSLQILRVVRRPVQRRYVLDSDRVVAGGRPPGRALERQLVARNDAAWGGQALPAGPALVFVGNVRGAISQRAWIPHTPLEGEVRVTLGASEQVLGLRRREGRVKGTPGMVEETYAIEIRNLHGQGVDVEISERPPVPLSWSVLRSNKPYELVDRRLVYRVSVPARENLVIRYTLQTPDMSF